MCFGVCLNQPHFRISIQHIPESMYFFSFSQSTFTPVKDQRSLWGRAREKGSQENSSTFNQDCSLENLTIPSFKEF